MPAKRPEGKPRISSVELPFRRDKASKDIFVGLGREHDAQVKGVMLMRSWTLFIVSFSVFDMSLYEEIRPGRIQNETNEDHRSVRNINYYQNNQQNKYQRI